MVGPPAELYVRLAAFYMFGVIAAKT